MARVAQAGIAAFRVQGPVAASGPGHGKRWAMWHGRARWGR